MTHIRAICHSPPRKRGELKAAISSHWNPAVRYDTAHGFAHRDRIWPSGQLEKQPLFLDNYNMAFTYATLDLKANWINYRKAYEQEMKK